MLRLLALIFIIFFFIPSYSKAEKFYTYKDFKNIFLTKIKKELNWVKGKIVLQQFRIEPENIQIPKSAIYKIRFFSSPHIGSNFMVITFYKNGKEIGIVRLWGYVEAEVPVVVITKPLNNKDIITKEDVVLKLKPLSRLPQDVITDKTEAIGKQTKMSLKPGTILRKSYIDLPILVKINQEIDIIARGKYFVVKAKGKALQNGRIGDVIKVKNLSSRKIIWAKVISPEEVEVNF